MATVTAGCKLPNGIIMEIGENRVVLQGTNSSKIIGGHGITENVDKDLFDAWMKKHKDKDFVKNGFVFANEKPADTVAQATEQEAEKTGLEPLNPDDKPKEITEVD